MGVRAPSVQQSGTSLPQPSGTIPVLFHVPFWTLGGSPVLMTGQGLQSIPFQLVGCTDSRSEVQTVAEAPAPMDPTSSTSLGKKSASAKRKSRVRRQSVGDPLPKLQE